MGDRIEATSADAEESGGSVARNPAERDREPRRADLNAVYDAERDPDDGTDFVASSPVWSSR